MHLTQLALQAYLARVRPAAVERHLRLCSGCAFRLSAVLAASGHWERRGPLQRLVWIDQAPTLDTTLDTTLDRILSERDAA